MSLCRLLALMSLAIGCSEEKPPSNLPIPIDVARQTALARVPGQIQVEELEHEDGRWMYEFDIQPTQPTTPPQEVYVDAQTGEIVKIQDDD